MVKERARSRDEGDETFIHAPVPGPRVPVPGKNLVFWSVETDESAGREFEDIMLRRVPGAVANHFRGAAGARGLTHAQYLTTLLALHEAARRHADTGDEQMAGMLSELGLQTVSI
jgi:hypothetical protein